MQLNCIELFQLLTTFRRIFNKSESLFLAVGHVYSVSKLLLLLVRMYWLFKTLLFSRPSLPSKIFCLTAVIVVEFPIHEQVFKVKYSVSKLLLLLVVSARMYVCMYVLVIFLPSLF